MTSPCLVASNVHSFDFKIPHPPNRNIPHTHGKNQPMVPKHNSPCCRIRLLPLMPPTNAASLKSLACSYYTRAIDSTLLTAIGELATEQSEGTRSTMDKLAQLFNYCASHPNASVRYTASDMLLAVESDASYLLSVIKARSRAAGYFYLTNTPGHPARHQSQTKWRHSRPMPYHA